MSYFPLLIEYQDNGSKTIVLDPQNIESGRPFKVLQVRYA